MLVFVNSKGADKNGNSQWKRKVDYAERFCAGPICDKETDKATHAPAGYNVSVDPEVQHESFREVIDRYSENTQIAFRHACNESL